MYFTDRRPADAVGAVPRHLRRQGIHGAVRRDATTPGPRPAGAAAQLEAFHGKQDPKAVEIAWPYLGHEDRYIRYAARVAIEHQDPKDVAGARSEGDRPAGGDSRAAGPGPRGRQDPFHARASRTGARHAERRSSSAGPHRLAEADRPAALDLLRVYAVLFNRLGPAGRGGAAPPPQALRPAFPAKSRELNAELCQLLVYLEAPGVAAKTLKLLAAAPTQEEQIEYAQSLRDAEDRLDAGAAQGILHVVPEGGQLQGRSAASSGSSRDDQGGRGGDPDAKEKEELKADPGSQAGWRRRRPSASRGRSSSSGSSTSWRRSWRRG